MKIQIEQLHLDIVRKVLSKIQNPIFVFGSRAKHTAHELSDLDLLIKGAVNPNLLSSIREELEESLIPYKVDIVLWDEIDDGFRNHIRKDLVELVDCSRLSS